MNAHADIEKRMLIKASDGDHAAFTYLYNKYKNKVYSLGNYLTGCNCLAEELTQDVFLKIWLNREELARIENFNAYLRTISRNLALNCLKRIATERGIIQKLGQETAFSDTTPENSLVLKNYEFILNNAINQLSPQVKRAYLLSRNEGLKQKEIAAAMNISYYTAKEYVNKAVSDIRGHMKKHIDVLILLCFLN